MECAPTENVRAVRGCTSESASMWSRVSGRLGASARPSPCRSCRCESEPLQQQAEERRGHLLAGRRDIAAATTRDRAREGPRRHQPRPRGPAAPSRPRARTCRPAAPAGAARNQRSSCCCGCCWRPSAGRCAAARRRRCPSQGCPQLSSCPPAHPHRLPPALAVGAARVRKDQGIRNQESVPRRGGGVQVDLQPAVLCMR